MSTIEVKDIVHLGGDEYAINTNGSDGKPDGSYDMVVIGRPGPDGTILLDLPNGAGTDMIVNPIYVGSSAHEATSSTASATTSSRTSSGSAKPVKISKGKIKAAAIVAAGFILFAIVMYVIEMFNFYF